MTKFSKDPLMETKFTQFKGLVYKYPGRILVELNNVCPIYCQFCTRKRETFKKEKWQLTNEEIEKILDFLDKNQEIIEVIISGGDPLMSPILLINLLKSLEKKTNIKIIRIHTRMPITSPSEIDKKIFEFLDSFEKVVYLSIHCNLAEEITSKSIEVFDKFRKSGVILYSQSVFLKGTNDSVEKLQKLFEKLLELGVRPYSIYRCDAVMGLEKFVVPFEKEKEIMTELRKRISGLACPTYVIDGESKKRFADFNGNLIKIDESSLYC